MHLPTDFDWDAKVQNMNDKPEQPKNPPADPNAKPPMEVSVWDLDPNSPAQMPVKMGSIDEYEVIEKIGEGGMGIVYRAKDPVTREDVAIKMLRQMFTGDPERVRDFNREVKQMVALGEMNHPNIIRILKFVPRESTPYFVMPYFPNGSLAQKLRGGMLPEREALRLGIQLAEALVAVHGKGPIHRDVTPHNVLIDANSNACLADFGLVRVLYGPDASIIQAGPVPRWAVGKPAYMAPEIASGEETGDSRIDVYSLGAVLYEMFSGRTPYEGESTKAILDQVRQRSSQPLSVVAPGLRRDIVTVVEGAMARELPDRYASMRYLLDDLRRLERGETPVGPKASRSKSGSTPQTAATSGPPILPVTSTATPDRNSAAHPDAVSSDVRPLSGGNGKGSSVGSKVAAAGCLIVTLGIVASLAAGGFYFRGHLSNWFGSGGKPVSRISGPPTTIPVPVSNADADELADQLQEKLMSGDVGGAIEIVGVLSQNDPRVSRPDRFHLITAVQHNRIEVVAEMIRIAPWITTATESDGSTALHVAAREGRLELITLLTEKGRMSPDVKDSNDQRPLHVAAKQNRRDAISKLLDAKADINATDLAGNTPLHVAGEWGTSETFDLLVSKGANASATNRRGQTPQRPGKAG